MSICTCVTKLGMTLVEEEEEEEEEEEQEEEKEEEEEAEEEEEEAEEEEEEAEEEEEEEEREESTEEKHISQSIPCSSLLTSWQFSESEVLHGACGDQRLLRVVEDVGQSVHPYMEVGDVDAHGLLPHGRLVGVSRRLVVVGEGDDGRTDTCTRERGRRKGERWGGGGGGGASHKQTHHVLITCCLITFCCTNKHTSLPL